MATVYDDVPPRVHDAPPVHDRVRRPGLKASAARVVGTVKTVAPPIARGAVQLGTVFVQFMITAATLSVVSFVVLLAAGYADRGVGPLLLCLLFALVAAVVGSVFAIVLGLPLRLSRRARLWWIRNGELALVAAAVAIALMAAAFAVGGSAGPVAGLLVPGWLLFATALANTWWPDRWRPERFRTQRPEPRVRQAPRRVPVRGDRRRAARASYDEFLAASGRAFRGERD